MQAQGCVRAISGRRCASRLFPRIAECAQSFDDLEPFFGRADEGDVISDGEDADVFPSAIRSAEYRVEAEEEELLAQGVSLGAACLSEDDLGGAIIAANQF